MMNGRCLLFVLLPVACMAQTRPDLYQCEGCEAVRERDFATLKSSAIIASPDEPGERLVLTGRVFKPDGRTPASGVVVYIHHTNAEGVYPSRPGDTGWARRHGYLRGWVITDDSGTYRFETIRPAPYRTRTDPAHIHMFVKEPDRQEYWIDDVLFTDDPLVTDRVRRHQQQRGGPGIVTPRRNEAGVWIVQRDIILER